MKRLFLLAVVALITTYSTAQTFILKGTVTKNNQPLPDVSVMVKETRQKTHTNSQGQYVLQISKGTYHLVFTHGSQKTITVQLNTNKVLNVAMNDSQNILEAAFISAIRVNADSPITFSNLNHKEIQERNLGQDIPILMNYMPNVVTTSDAGAGIGYTGIRVRGSDATRINITINGIPLNDAESQGAFWVDLGDFTSSIQDLQLQRGVGSSTNGAGAFGASLNVRTLAIAKQPSAAITTTVGSFNTQKHQLEVNTGLINNHFAFSANFSLLKSDGYRDRAFSDLKSYFLQGVYQNKNTRIKVLGFGGAEKTYQAYYAISAEKLKTDRTFNPAGMYTDSTGTTQFYGNQTDNYKQDHFQLLWNQQYNAHWSSNLAFHYTYGRGYYESFHEDADLHEYHLPYFTYNGKTQSTSDLIDQDWLSNHFYGTVFNVNYQKNTVKAIVGGAWNNYLGDHYGSVVYTKFAQNPLLPGNHFYDNDATKTDFNLYGKITIALSKKLAVFGDMQWRMIHYHTRGPLDEGQLFNVNDSFNFFNPKAGITYQLTPGNQLYFSYARANHEPSRADYKSAVLENPTNPTYPEAEQLNDFELGWRHKTTNFQLNANLYYMAYQNQLVLTGAIDNTGRFIRTNSGQSYRMGVELSAQIKVTNNFEILPNLSLSQNKNKNFITSINGKLKHFGNTNISFSPSIVAGNMVRWQPVKNLQLNFLTKFVGKQYLSNIEAADSRLDSYLVNSFNVQYSWKNAPLFKEVVFTGLVNNIFNEKYASNGYYSPGYGAAYYPQAGINFLAGITLKI